MKPKASKTLKAGWRRVKFGDVVRLAKARSADPLADGLERYVGLEHLEPGDLRIRSWGNVADGVTFTNVFQPEQVLFGKRRAYQRKVAVAVAVADFASVCSGDIYVMESQDPRVLLPALLPFICQTDAFFDHAVGTSAGSLSPRTIWPADAAARAWARSASAEMHSGFGTLRTQCAMNCALRVALHEVDAALQKDVSRVEELWCEGLARFGGPFLAGERFTAVDAFFCPVAFRVQTYGLQLNEAASAYCERLLNLPAMRQWVEQALAETWIEPSHEQACLQYGQLVTDLRQGQPA